MTTELVNIRTGEMSGMEPLIRAERMLAEIASVEDALNVVDFAEAARVYVQRAGLGVRSENHATVIKVCAEIRLAEMVKAGQEVGQIAKKGRPENVAPGDIKTLADIGLTRQRLSQARKMAAKWTREAIRECADECSDLGVALSRKQLLNGEIVQQSLTNEWYTPTQYLDAARAVLGSFDLDPASCAEANDVVRANRFYSAEDDGLAQPWFGRVWLNPPYGRLAGHFIDRLVECHRTGQVTEAIALVNAHCTDTRWFQALWDHALCFTDHRIDFAAGTTDRSGSTHGSVFAYFGPDGGLFVQEFAQFGAIVRRWP